MNQIEKLRWRIDRLRAMGLPEIQHRFKLEATKRAWKTQGFPTLKLAPSLEMILATRGAFFGLPSAPATLDLNVLRDHPETAALLLEADGYLQHQWRYFSFRDQASKAREDMAWQECDKTGLVADANAFGPDLDYRDASVVGNVKYTWEKSRHHHTQVLALAYAITKDERYAQAAFKELFDWIAHNPAPKGINWTSALELGVRLISWAFVYQLLRDHHDWQKHFAPASPFWQSVYQHQVFLAAYESKGSSANNHLLGEVAGLYIAAQTWPVFAESKHWREEAKTILEREIHLQVFPSGVNREMGFEYHVFSLELFLLPAMLGKQHQDNFSKAYWESIARQVRVLPMLQDTSGNLPRYGDADEAYAAQLQARSTKRIAYLYNLARRALGIPVPAQEDGVLMTRVLVGDQPDNAPPAVPTPNSFAFGDAGLYSIASQRGTPNEILVLADAGPHGYLSIAGHGHADALAFAVSAFGAPVLVDPGTFVYHTDLEWRRVFKSTRYHNTLEIDDQDQSVQAGAFMWSHKANSFAHAFEPRQDGGTLTISHDGYERLPGKPKHTRHLELRDTTLHVRDVVTGSGTHTLRLHFHFHPECEVSQTENGAWLIRFGAGQATLHPPAGSQATLFLGDENARLGFYSPGFDQKVPAPCLQLSLKDELPQTLETRLEFHK